MQTEELKQIAKERGLKLLSIPKIFKVRWTEWTYTTVVNILTSWNALMIYFQENNDNATAAGFFTFFSQYENRTYEFQADFCWNALFRHNYRNLGMFT